MPARGAVEMSGVARERHASDPVARDDALMHPVGALLQYRIGLGPGHHLLKARLDGRIGELFLDGGVLARIDRDPPAPRNLEQAEITALLPAIADVGEPLQMLLEGHARRDEQRGLGIGLPLEAQADGLAREAARAVRAEEKAGPHLLPLCGRDGHALLVLRQVRKRCPETKGYPGFTLEARQEGEGELPLLALQPIGMPRLPGEHREIEDGALAARVQADLPIGADEPLGHEFARDAERLQHVEGRRMKGGRAQVAHDLRLRLEHLDVEPGAREEEGGAEADRARPRDDDLGVARSHPKPSPSGIDVVLHLRQAHVLVKEVVPR
jgi:hypothetical protein